MKSNLKTSLVMFLVIFLFLSIFLSSFAADAAKYHFISILWMQGDPNLNWIIKSGQDYMAINKDVDIEFTGPQNYDVTKHLEFLEAAIAKKPDGIYMHVSDPTTLKPAFEKAKKGI